MRKKIIGFILILAVGFAFGQVATRQAFRDFDAFIGLMDSTDSSIQNVYNHIVSLESEEVAIMDDAERKAEMKKIIDIHPDYSISEIQAKLATFATLKTYLIDNGYLEE